MYFPSKSICCWQFVKTVGKYSNREANNSIVKWLQNDQCRDRYDFEIIWTKFWASNDWTLLNLCWQIFNWLLIQIDGYTLLWVSMECQLIKVGPIILCYFGLNATKMWNRYDSNTILTVQIAPYDGDKKKFLCVNFFVKMCLCDIPVTSILRRAGSGIVL